MGLFGPKKLSYLGVDLGAGGIKLLELSNEKGRARLVTYGFTERLPDVQTVNLVDNPKETAELLRKVAQRSKATSPRAVAGLPISSVFSSVISVPKGTDKELQEAIQWQARKLIPVPLEDMVLDFKRINPPEKGKEKQPVDKNAPKKDEQKTEQVLITGASKAMVQKYVAVFKTAGIELVSLETEAFALIRSLIGKDKATTMIVDIGAIRTNIIVVENGIPFVTRSLDMGGVSLTKAMGRALSLDLKAAEQMKTDIKSVSTIYPGEGLPQIFSATIMPLITEINQSIEIYAGTDPSTTRQVEKIVLTGGSAALPSLAPYITKQMNIKTYLGDPWARIVYPDEIRSVLDEIGPRFAVAVGLAMHKIE